MANYDKNEDYPYLYPGFPVKGKRLVSASYKVISETSFVEPVTVDEFKSYAFIDFDTDDTAIADIIKSSRIQAEQYLQKSLGVKTIEFKAFECPENYKLLWGPVDEILTTGFTEFNGLLLEGGDKITVQFTTTADAVNQDVKEAIMSQTYYRYENRSRFLEGQSVVNIQDAFKEKLNPYRNISWP